MEPPAPIKPSEVPTSIAAAYPNRVSMKAPT